MFKPVKNVPTPYDNGARPGWLFMYLLKYVHGIDGYVNEWQEWVSYRTRAIPEVAEWTVTLHDGTVLYPNFHHPQYQAFVQDRAFVVDAVVNVAYVDGTTARYEIVDGVMK